MSGFASKVGQTVTIDGTARNARMGAVVLTDERTPIYLEGLQEWDSSTNGKPVAVTGELVLRSLAPNPTVGPNGEVSHGMEGDAYVVRAPTWNVVDA